MAKIFNFNRNVDFCTDICEQCGKECDENSCLSLEMLRQLCLIKNPSEQLAMLRNVAKMFNYEDGDA